ncbi:MAG: hypothetical protein M1817_001697 [Caeruleum heppii]|nr:MAG: hypothetical protein M1817_001697 [Caeruleum heppii]
MAHRQSAPYAPQDPPEVARLLQSLEAHTKKDTSGKKSFSCKKSTFIIPGPKELTVDSWRFQDWDYKRDDLPIYARGLFTNQFQRGTPELVVRGYDKFFNVDEVSKTKWNHIENHTRGPYELSLKENGCIIFISGLADNTLLICSKHSTGPRQDADLSHAVAGERWVDRQLNGRGRTRADLAKQLRRMNATAVAELCDDSFEEHVLAYRAEQAGLYLHGINLNLLQFATYPGHLVQSFAADWGFKSTDFLLKDDISSVRAFLEQVTESGSWNGRDVEGFVIRCQAREDEKGSWHDYFFKFKFEEPYLMYRQWREVTKAVIAGKPPRYKKHKQVTEEYLQYARGRLKQDPQIGKAFAQNHGIIAMRDGFLREKGVRGSDLVRLEGSHNESGQPVTKDVVLVPIATIGCGKTTVAVALTKLFGWGHVQNDNIEGRKNRPQRFAGQVCSTLALHSAVIADRNNHQKRERKQIMDDVQRLLPDARFVALHYVHERQGLSRQDCHDRIRKTMRDRVLSRGDNHQTIQAGSKSQQEIIGIMDGFMARFEPVDAHNEPDDGFDAIIDLDVTASSRENLETVVAQLHNLYPKLFQDMPTASDLDDAMDNALRNYKPDVKHSLDFSKNKPSRVPGQPLHNGQAPRAARIDYFCIRLPTPRVLGALEDLFTAQSTEQARFYRQLQQSRRLQPAYHVTLIHRANSTTCSDKWQKYTTLYETQLAFAGPSQSTAVAQADPELGTCRVQLERVVWDHRVMCIVARLLDGEERGFATTNEVAHVTVGTASQEIKPKESNDLLAKWLVQGSGAQSGVGELALDRKIVLDGSVRAVLQHSRPSDGMWK